MEELNQIIRSYLEAESTDYAIMINGDWGSGKSYYIKHDLWSVVTNVGYTQEISKLDGVRTKITSVSTLFTKKQRDDNRSTNYDARKYYPFYVSLYGISSIADFNSKVADGVHDWVKKGFDIATSFTKDKFGVSIPLGVGVYIPHNAVLVFDDLERICSDKITPTEVLGMINSYAEHQNKKVIIVCNEAEFCKQTTEYEQNSNGTNNFLKYKEKTIRFTYTYKPDISSVYDTFAKECKDAYATYLAKNKEDVLDIFRIGGKQNLRTLKFFVDIYNKIFKALQRVDLGKYADVVLRKLMTTTLIYVMEYKQGVQKQDLLRLQKQNDFSTIEWLRQISNKTSKSENEKNTTPVYDVNAVQQKYGEVFDDMVQIPWIVDYMMTGAMHEKDVENFAKLQMDVEKRKDGSLAVQELHKLKNYTALEDKEVEDIYHKILENIKQDQYTMYELLDAYSVFVKYVINRVNGIQLNEELDAQFKQALDRAAKNHTYDPMFERSAIQWDRSAMGYAEVKRYYELRKYAKELNERVNMREYENELEQFLRVIEAGANIDAIENYWTNNNSNLSLKRLDWNRFYNALLIIPNPMACTVIICVERLLLNDYSTWSNKEYEDLKVFNEKLQNHVKHGDGRVRSMYMQELVMTVSDYLNKNYRWDLNQQKSTE